MVDEHQSARDLLYILPNNAVKMYRQHIPVHNYVCARYSEDQGTRYQLRGYTPISRDGVPSTTPEYQVAARNNEFIVVPT
jgi:hypothetical protein